ncbi:hypothetical protein RRG08_010885 [Elysia crispata]|uniref:Uncharacterized protein n=1 Tax=Elysia crispata TaxID=231223 RepID=A0AAE1D563_9GAST|nr:hypothetical protein RRG08_010885 [Elysia crispata]
MAPILIVGEPSHFKYQAHYRKNYCCSSCLFSPASGFNNVVLGKSYVAMATDQAQDADCRTCPTAITRLKVAPFTLQGFTQ